MLSIISSKLQFDSTVAMKEAWNDAITKAKKEHKIDFDLENNDNVGDIKEIKIGEDIYLVQLWSAGGDWQFPTYYFKIQEKDRNWRPLIVFIPEKEEGNGNLEKGKNGCQPIGADSKHEDARNEDKAWTAVKKHLKKINKEYYERYE